MLIAARNAILAGGGSQPSGGYWGLCFTAEEANSTVAMVANGSAPSVNLLYSTNPADPTSWTEFKVGSTQITLASVGDKVWLKAGTGGNTQFATSTSNYNAFSLSGLVAASGSIMSLLDGDNETLSIPAIYCFLSLFYGCYSLTTAPMLPATTLLSNCYRNMFNGCTSLTTTPALPAETLVGYCYYQMFVGCISLISAELSATTLNSLCLQLMFDGCSALSSIQVQFTKFNAIYNANWVKNVAATGTFYCPAALGTHATITRGVSACPAGWTVVNTDA